MNDLIKVKQDWRNLQYVINQTEEICMAAIKKDGNAIQYVRDQTDKLQYEAIRQDWESLQYIRNQTPSIVKYAIRHDANAVQYSRSMSDKILKCAIDQNPTSLAVMRTQYNNIVEYALSKDGTVIDDVRKPTLANFITAVRTSPHAIHVIHDMRPNMSESDMMQIYTALVETNGLYIEDIMTVTPDLVIAAIKQNPLAYAYLHETDLITDDDDLMYIFKRMSPHAIYGDICECPNYHRELGRVMKDGYYIQRIDHSDMLENDPIYMAAVTQDPHSLYFIDASLQTEALCLAAVNIDGMALQHVVNQTDKICMAAVKQNSRALQFVVNQTEKICIAACRKSGYALQAVQVQTDAICLAAVKSSGWSLDFVINQTEEICLAAVKKAYSSYDKVQNKTYAITKHVSDKWGAKLEDQKESTCIKAVTRFWTLLENVQVQTADICIAALKNNLNAAALINYNHMSTADAERVKQYITFLTIQTL